MTATVNGATRFKDNTTVTVSVGGGSATSGADYAAVANFNIVISAGAASATGTFDLDPTQDTLHEGSETIDVTGTSRVTVTKDVISITDDDAEPSFAIADASAAEGGAITFTVTRSGATGAAATVKWNTAADTAEDASQATAGTDYTAVTTARTLSFAIGVTTQTFTVATAEDNLHEGDETFLVKLTDATGGATISDDEATGTITDDDAAPTGITLTAAPDTLGEGAAATEITVTATVNGATRFKDNTTVTVSVGGGSATSGADYAAVANFNIVISAGAASATGTFDLDPTQDTLHEGSETIDVTGTSRVTVTKDVISITDDDAEPSFAIADASAAEGGAITFTVTRSGATGAAATVKWNTAADTAEDASQATAGTDYTAVTTARTLSFAIGVTTQTFTVATAEDNLHEGDETFLVKLTDATGGATISDDEATGTITDDDDAPTAFTLTVDADTGTDNVQDSITENGGAKTARITATLDGASTFTTATTVTVKVGTSDDSATEATDYDTVADQTITIPAGASSAHVDFTLTPKQDVLAEGDETIALEGSAAGLTATDTEITLTDDDAAPTGITLTAAPDTLGEGAAATEITVTATVNGATRFKDNTTVTVSVGGGSATSGADYAAVANFNIVISAGAASATGTFDLDPTQDTLHEGSETIDVTGTSRVTVTKDVISITDDDAEPSFAIADASAAEGGAITFTVTRSGATGAAATVKWNTAADTAEDASQATAGTDYTAVTTARTLSFAIGVTTQTFTVATAEDNLHEGDETFLVKLTDATGGATISDDEATGTITDDDAAPTGITLTAAPDTLGEGAAATEITVTATVNGATRFKDNTTVTVSVGGGSATSGADYAAVANFNIVISAGAASATGTFDLDPTQDTLHEGSETIDVTGTSRVTVTKDVISITDDDAEPSFAIADASAAEGGAITFTVTRSGATGAAATVKWNTAADTAEDASQATAGTDYTAVTTARTLSFAIGVTTQTFTVATAEDNLHEGDETFLVKLTDATGGATISDDEATGTITDDDDAPTAFTLTVDADTGTDNVQDSITENGGAKTARITATLDGASTFTTATTVTVKVGTSDDSATEATDYDTVADQTITIPAGASSAHVDFTLTPKQDVLAEGDETIALEGSAAGLTATDTEITLTDDDAAPTGITLTAAPDTLGEGAAATEITVTATVNGATRFKDNTTVTVSVGGGSATSGADYAAVANFNIVISAGAASATGTFDLDPTQDTLHEGSETIDVTGTSRVTVTKDVISITDDDAEPSFAIADASAAEGGAITFTVTRSGATGAAATVKWNTAADTAEDASQATAGTDYTAVTTARTLSFAIGVTTQTFTVATAEDNLHEGDETFLVKLTDATGGATISDDEATGTITDDDAAPTGITLTAAPDTLGEGAAATEITVTATVNGATRFKDNTTVTVSVGGGSATSGADYAAVANFNIVISAGAASATGTFDLDPTQDTLHEGSETIDVTGTSRVTVTKDVISITDDDAEPSFAIADASAAEGGAITFTVTRSGATGAAATVKWNTAADTAEDASQATAGTDYTAVTTARTLSFAIGVTTQTFTVATAEDNLHEGDETFLVKLTDATGGATISDDEATGTITDDDAPTAFTLTDADTGTDNVQDSITENGGAKTARITATLDGASTFTTATTVTVKVGTSDDSATEATTTPSPTRPSPSRRRIERPCGLHPDPQAGRPRRGRRDHRPRRLGGGPHRDRYRDHADRRRRGADGDHPHGRARHPRRGGRRDRDHRDRNGQRRHPLQGQHHRDRQRRRRQRHLGCRLRGGRELQHRDFRRRRERHRNLRPRPHPGHPPRGLRDHRRHRNLPRHRHQGRDLDHRRRRRAELRHRRRQRRGGRRHHLHRHPLRGDRRGGDGQVEHRRRHGRGRQPGHRRHRLHRRHHGADPLLRHRRDHPDLHRRHRRGQPPRGRRDLPGEAHRRHRRRDHLRRRGHRHHHRRRRGADGDHPHGRARHPRRGGRRDRDHRDRNGQRRHPLQGQHHRDRQRRRRQRHLGCRLRGGRELQHRDFRRRRERHRNLRPRPHPGHPPRGLRDHRRHRNLPRHRHQGRDLDHRRRRRAELRHRRRQRRGGRRHHLHRHPLRGDRRGGDGQVEHRRRHGRGRQPGHRRHRLHRRHHGADPLLRHRRDHPDLHRRHRRGQPPRGRRDLPGEAHRRHRRRDHLRRRGHRHHHRRRRRAYRVHPHRRRRHRHR